MKKAYIIPLVILLLFVSVVPSFASDVISVYRFNSDATVFTNYSYTQSFFYTDNGKSKVVYSDNTLKDQVFMFRNLPSGVTSCIFSCTVKNSDITKVSLTLRNNYSQSTLLYVVDVHQDSYFIFVPFEVGNYTFIQLIVDSSTSSDTTFSYPQILITSEFVSDPSSYIFDTTQYFSNSPNYYVKGSPNILSFYGSLFHTFDFVPDITTTYAASFAIGAGILAILIFIFVVVFLIKRFTGGKC